MTAADDFFERVYDVVKNIPYGRVTTYGAIAAHLGAKRSARTVGYALNKSFSRNDHIPAHRVVNRNGLLTGKHHFPGANMMEDLLVSEGVLVQNDKVVDFETHLWVPQ